ncbi:MAG: type VI secretion system protein TssA [Holosporaceae bacterium]|jgi:type VI secretion system protein ImpA|nr:type VI secretion system protein TssA [Holosporaceae bacterium]
MAEFEELLLPISEKNRCGEDLKYDYVYDQIRELRREDDPRLSQGIWQTAIKKADWPEVFRICSHLLKTKTKDLQIAMWLLESLTVMKGFHGFNCGMSLLQSLCENYWDDIYPSVDWENRNFIPRLAPFYFLAEKIPERIVLIPLAKQTDATGDYSLSDWLTARRNLQIKNTDGLSLGQIKKGVLATPQEFVESLGSEVRLAIENLKKLDDFIVEQCNDDSPSFRLLLNHLEDAERTTAKNLQIKRNQMAETVAKAEARRDQPKPVDEDGNSSSEEEPVKKEPTLEDAYDLLKNIGLFLERKQPQSPAAILIKIASVIGKKNFQELLDINVKNGAPVMSTISELYRVLIPEEKKEGE